MQDTDQGILNLEFSRRHCHISITKTNKRTNKTEKIQPQKDPVQEFNAHLGNQNILLIFKENDYCSSLFCRSLLLIILSLKNRLSKK